MTEKHEWVEDEVYGVYEVSLTLDVSTLSAALEADRLLRHFLDEVNPPRCGHLLKTVRVTGWSQKRV